MGRSQFKTFQNGKLLLYTLSILTAVFANEDCNYQETCDSCIKASFRCYWCADGGFDDKAFPEGRCSDKASHCNDNSSNIRVFSSIDSASSESVKVIKLRNDEEFSFTVDVESQPDLPFQMYFLLDGSRSMLKALDSIKVNSIELAKQVTQKWSKSIVGLGIFNDKETVPFTFINLTTTKLIDNIPETEFPFWDMVVKLVPDTDEFAKKINEIKIKQLADVDNDPEGHTDVISQALTCKSELGFKEKSDTRHLIFLTTDAPFWIAGDGRFGGIITPPTDECRGTTNSEQSAASILYDYPSVGFLKYLLQLRRVYLVASVTNDVYENAEASTRSYAKINEHVYSALETELSGLAEYVGNRFDSSESSDENLDPLSVNGVMDKLDQISKRVSLVASGEDMKNFVIKFNIDKGSCPPGSIEKTNANDQVIACENVAKGGKVRINVVIKQKEGVKLTKRNEFFLNLPGVHPKTDLVTVRIDHLEAECTNCGPIDQKTEQNYPKKCVHGDLECGVCLCEEGWHASDCDCPASDVDNEPAAQHCKEGPEDTETCNGNGDCYCGECECSENAFGNPFVGTFCQCDPDSCPTGDNEETCWGRGSCLCNAETSAMECKCVDEEKWDASTNCKCRTNGACIDPNYPSEELCNGRATGCMCEGKCACNNGFSGDFCELCEKTSCMASICTEARYQNLIACAMLNKKCEANLNEKFNITTNLDEALQNKWKKCTAELGDGCKAYFYVNDRDKDIFHVAYDTRKMCDEPFPVWIIILIVVLVVLFLGLLVIIGWKGFIKYQEKIEYEQFLKDQEGAMTAKGNNPLFQDTQQTVMNPTYQKKQ